MSSTCPELVGKKKLEDGGYRYRSEAEIRDLARRANERTDLQKYRGLHQDGRRLIDGWFERAWAKRDCEPEASFEPFVFAFIALNAWASCVTGRDSDRGWRDALALNRTLRADFDRLVADTSSPVAAPARKFRQLWPVFEVQRLRQRGIGLRYERDPLVQGGRQRIIDAYLNHPRAGSLGFEPQCWMRHREAGEGVPLDWPHTLAALYRVRCNLFHGEKARHSEMDRLIVAGAFRTLVGFLGGAEYIRPRSTRERGKA